MSIKLLAAGLLAGAALIVTPALAQNSTSGTKADRENGRVTKSDQDGGGSSTGSSMVKPNPAVGNNTSKGTDAKGTVDPPSRDRDANDALKKKE